jgi:hypothetical protein
MTSFALGVALVTGAYRFDASTQLNYDVNVVFDGFLPILGGNTGTADVKLGVRVGGLAPKEEAMRATSELTAFELSFNGGKLPLDLTSAQVYFPKTTANLNEKGKVLSSDAPNITLPVRLPGLDVKRFPEITYVPIEFGTVDLVVGSKWSFDRNFGDTPIKYECEVKELKTGGIVAISVTIQQEYETLENESLEIVPEIKAATSRVKTTLEGSGLVLFDSIKGVAAMVDMSNKSLSTVTEIATGKTSTRQLNSMLKVKLKGFEVPKVAPSRPVTLADQAIGAFKGLWQKGNELWSSGVGYLQVLRMGLAMALSQVPGTGQWVRLLTGGSS